MKLAFAIVCASRIAMAEPSAFLDVVPPTGGAPAIRATLIAGPRGACTLDGVPASEERGFDADAPIAIAIVVNDQELMGAYIGDEGEDRGQIDDVKAAFDRVDVTKLGRGEFTVIGYDTGAHVMRDAAPLAQLKGPAFGERKDYMKKLGTDLVQGIRLGLDTLERSPATRKVLIVIGDGNDTNNETAAHELTELAQRARTLHVEPFAFVVKTAVSSEGAIVENFTPPVATQSAWTLERALEQMMVRLTDRRTLAFPGERFTWDGTLHLVALVCGGVELGRLELVLAPAWSPPARSKLPFVVIGIAIMAIIAALVALARRRA